VVQHADGGHPVMTLEGGPTPAPRAHSQHPQADEDDIIVPSDSDEEDAEDFAISGGGMRMTQRKPDLQRSEEV
jgi:hypothetical protein